MGHFYLITRWMQPAKLSQVWVLLRGIIHNSARFRLGKESGFGPKNYWAWLQVLHGPNPVNVFRLSSINTSLTWASLFGEVGPHNLMIQSVVMTGTGPLVLAQNITSHSTKTDRNNWVDWIIIWEIIRSWAVPGGRLSISITSDIQNRPIWYGDKYPNGPDPDSVYLDL